MRFRGLLQLIIAIVFVGQAFGQGVQFETTSYDKVVDKARDNHKLIFVDVYADWCAPCKMMDKQTFPDSIAGAYMNEHFVSYKANYKSPTGSMLARKHGVSSFPTYLFIDPKGNLIYKARGFMKPERLINEAKVASNPGVYNKFQLFKKKFNSGNRDPEMLQEYLILGAERYKMPSDEVYLAYYKALDLMDKQDEGVLKILARYLPYVDIPAYELSKAYVSGLDSTKVFKGEIIENMINAVDRTVQKNCEEKPGEILDQIMQKHAEILKLKSPDSEEENQKKTALIELDYMECGGHWKDYATFAGKYASSFIISPERKHRDTTVEKSLEEVQVDQEDAQTLAHFASNVEQNAKNVNHYADAIEWIDQAIAWNNIPEYHGIKAYLFKRQGRKGEAIDVARRALEKARKIKSPYAKEMENILMTIVDGERNKGINLGK